jgi:hypothetical protein
MGKGCGVKRALFLSLAVTLSATNVGDLGAQPPSAPYCKYRSAGVLFLVDITTRYDDADRQQFESALTELLARLRYGERLIVRSIEETFERSRVLFDRCLPGCPSKGFGDLLSDCKPLIASVHAIDFKQALVNSVREVHQNSQDQKRSDLLNVLRSHTSFLNQFKDEKEIWFFSDMLENASINVRRFQGSTESLLRVVHQKNLIPQLKHVKVRIYGMARADTFVSEPPTKIVPGKGKKKKDGPPKEEELHKDRLSKREYDRVVDFWRGYFRASGAEVVHIQE